MSELERVFVSFRKCKEMSADQSHFLFVKNGESFEIAHALTSIILKNIHNHSIALC